MYGGRGMPSVGGIHCHRLFTGLRTGELASLDWENIHLVGSQRFIEVAARKAKTRQRRIVSISDILDSDFCFAEAALRLVSLNTKTAATRLLPPNIRRPHIPSSAAQTWRPALAQHHPYNRKR